LFFFFQAEDGIRDIGVTGSSDVCSSDLSCESWLLFYQSNNNMYRWSATLFTSWSSM